MKLICITGGVLSGIGKGITGASIGALLKASGYHITMQKFDGYLNIDASMIDPQRHGESFITADGAETDLDIGHYERFIDTPMTRQSSYTMGRLYQEIINLERSGRYGGVDVQMIPHMTNLISSKIIEHYHHSQADISIIEIGGTVGDIENEAIIESLRQLRSEYGKNNILVVHVVYLPYIVSSQELKTKPAQNAVRDLRERGIVPDFLIMRADQDIPDTVRQKLASVTGLAYQNTIPVPTLESIYLLPQYLNNYTITTTILKQLQLKLRKPKLNARKSLTKSITTKKKKTLQIAIIGEYDPEGDVYYSLIEALKLSAWRGGYHATILIFSLVQITKENIYHHLENCDAVVISSGNISENYLSILEAVIEYAQREHMPYLGIDGGAYALIRYDEHISQRGRLPQPGDKELSVMTHSKLANYYDNRNTITERYRYQSLVHKEDEYVLQASKLQAALVNNRYNTIDARESLQHPFMVGVTFHPELLSRTTTPHPLINELIKQAGNYKKSRKTKN